MRTCPACGKDTEAQTTEPCTECGFSPVGTTGAPPEASVGEAPPSGYGFPDEPEAPAPARKGSGVAPIWIVLIVIGLAWQAFNLLDGCGEIFVDNPGPTPEETESALESDASRQGVASPTADCPDLGRRHRGGCHV